MKLRNTLIFMALLPTLWVGTATTTALRAAQGDERGRAEDMAREAIEQLMRALDLMLDSIPQYELPEIMENGDIIIRRREDAPPLPQDDGEEPGEEPGVRT